MWLTYASGTRRGRGTSLPSRITLADNKPRWKHLPWPGSSYLSTMVSDQKTKDRQHKVVDVTGRLTITPHHKETEPWAPPWTDCPVWLMALASLSRLSAVYACLTSERMTRWRPCLVTVAITSTQTASSSGPGRIVSVLSARNLSPDARSNATTDGFQSTSNQSSTKRRVPCLTRSLKVLSWSVTMIIVLIMLMWIMHKVLSKIETKFKMPR